MHPKNEIFSVALFLGFFGIAAFVLMYLITPYGSGVSPDSIYYLAGAKNILLWKGFSINGSPITYWPPFYSIFLAATDLLTNNLVLAARILNAILFGINIGLIALLVYLAVGRTFFTTIIAVFFCLSSSPLIELHAWAWSEPLFISLSLASILFLCLYINRRTYLFLIISSLSLGFALVTRYIGMAFIPAILFIVFLIGCDNHFVRRLWDSLICLLLTCAPLVIFMIRNMILVGTTTSRNFGMHPLPLLQYIMQICKIIFTFVVPISLPAVANLIVIGLIATYLIVQIIILFKRHSREINWRSMDTLIPISCLMFSFFYLLFLYISISFFDAATPIDTRILSPILVIFIVGVFSTIRALSQTNKQPIMWSCFICLIVISVLLKTPDAIKSSIKIQNNGLGYTSRQWQNSKSVAYVKLFPDDKIIYSNDPYIFLFLAENKSISIPFKYNTVNAESNTLYNQEIYLMCKAIIEKKALLVYFNQYSESYYPSQQELASSCKLSILRRFGDGTVYGDITPK